MTYSEILNVRYSSRSASLIQVAPLDFRTPFDELTELRSVLTAGEISELTGLRRETISRARPDSRFRRRTEKALRDLYAVIVRMRALPSAEMGQLASILRLPQPLLEGRSIADFLKEGRVDEVLEYLALPEPGTAGQVDTVRLDPVALATLGPSEETPEASAVPRSTVSAVEARRAADLVEADPELALLLPSIEALVRDRFGAEALIERGVVPAERDDPGDSDHLYLRISSALPFDLEMDRLADLLAEEAGLLEPVSTRLTIGIL
jgi:hypothetical protein